jgi:hypothetical protein
MNCNVTDAKMLKEIMDKENLNWRSFTGQQQITARWNNPGTPSYYVIDHQGVIRYKWVGYPGEAIDTALETLIEEVEGNLKKSPK